MDQTRRSCHPLPHNCPGPCAFAPGVSWICCTVSRSWPTGRISRDIVYKELIPAGLPHTRDDTGRIWIHGPAAATWILDQKRKVKRSLKAGEFLCLHCRQAVSPDPASLTTATSGRFTYVKAVCPICSTTVCKGAVA